ncbi:hypothetical protein B6N60_01949 [Richelia sinica FACHB-800]|uniref:Uncharacterized protein n=1 Tax=Richelia sinica FACHB-800 TaxID=1357546 RepID=A0A975T725_9NOST|nr:hypothetical protein B6N60_01949 [Richelia sinica FACHB-800]
MSDNRKNLGVLFMDILKFKEKTPSSVSQLGGVSYQGASTV